jgi:hypothetical protein
MANQFNEWRGLKLLNKTNIYANIFWPKWQLLPADLSVATCQQTGTDRDGRCCTAAGHFLLPASGSEHLKIVEN